MMMESTEIMVSSSVMIMLYAGSMNTGRDDDIPSAQPSQRMECSPQPCTTLHFRHCIVM